MEKPIIGFEGYTMDVDTGRVFSYRGTSKREMMGFTTKRGRKMLHFMMNSKRITLGWNRLWYCVLHDIPPRKMPRDLMVTMLDGKPRLIDATERAKIASSSKLTAMQRYRIQFMNRKIKELEMMKDYYMTGNFTPIRLYAENLRNNMVVWFCRHYGMHERRSEEVFELAYTQLEERINHPGSSVCDILLMLKHLMINTHRNLARECRIKTEEEYQRICKAV